MVINGVKFMESIWNKQIYNHFFITRIRKLSYQVYYKLFTATFIFYQETDLRQNITSIQL